MKKQTVEVIDLENGDFIVVVRSGKAYNYVHHYNDMKQAAHDVSLVCAGDTTTAWDGNEMERDGWTKSEGQICQHFDVNGCRCYTALEFLELVD